HELVGTVQLMIQPHGELVVGAVVWKHTTVRNEEAFCPIGGRQCGAQPRCGACRQAREDRFLLRRWLEDGIISQYGDGVEFVAIQPLECSEEECTVGFDRATERRSELLPVRRGFYPRQFARDTVELRRKG